MLHSIWAPLFGTGFFSARPWRPRGMANSGPLAATASRHAAPGLLARLFGFLWGLFWIFFGLSFAFGGDEFRQAVKNLILQMTRVLTDMINGLTGMMQ